MKLRLHNSSLRLRLTQPEVNAIARGESVHCVSHFPDGREFSYELSVADGSAVTAHFDGEGIAVVLPPEIATAWATGDSVSIEQVQSVGDDTFRILVEKDFDCLHPRPEDAGEATFPNPNA